jgi:predicted nucleic acid-binding Zn ribbon protein
VPEPDQAPDRATLAFDALAKAKSDAAARGALPPVSFRGNLTEKKPEDLPQPAPPAGAHKAGRPRREDPAPLNTAITGLVREAGWELAVATGSVFGRWAEIVGPALADHTSPESLTEGVLVVNADSSAWAVQVQLMAATLVRQLNVELGDGSVKKVHVRGPGGSTRTPGRLRVRGSRGDRDTYG